MTQSVCTRIKNAMLIANFISNAIGIVVVLFLAETSPSTADPEMFRLANRIHLWFIPVSILSTMLLTLLYERPVRRHIDDLFRDRSCAEASASIGRRRLLNEPFFLIAVDFGMWLGAAVVYSGFFMAAGADLKVIQSVFIRNLLTGLITVTVAFFVFEFVLQRRIVPHVFSEGGLYMTPGTTRIRIRTRLVALLFACNLVPFIATLSAIPSEFPKVGSWQVFLEETRFRLASQALIFMGVGVWLTFLVSSNLTRPLGEMIRVLREIRNGRFEHKVRVTTNDEIGYTGDVINEMTEGLKEREFVKETFGKYVTKEVRDEILSGRVPLDGELREVTVLFADLRGFTPMVERIPPKEVVKILNQYFREMDEAIRQNEGLVLQFIGDEIEAVFGAPVFREDHPGLAVGAAEEMTRRLRALNEALLGQGYPALSHGIGIHTGEVVAANIGSPDRLSYTLVGDTVNLASRLQDLNKDLDTEIIISAATVSRISRPISFIPLPPQKVKGKSREIEIYTLAESKIP